MQSIYRQHYQTESCNDLYTNSVSAVPPKGDMPHKAIGYRGVSKVGEHMVILSEQFLHILVSERTYDKAPGSIERQRGYIPWYKDRDARVQHHTHQNSSYHPPPSNAAQ